MSNDEQTLEMGQVIHFLFIASNLNLWRTNETLAHRCSSLLGVT